MQHFPEGLAPERSTIPEHSPFWFWSLIHINVRRNILVHNCTVLPEFSPRATRLDVQKFEDNGLFRSGSLSALQSGIHIIFTACLPLNSSESTFLYPNVYVETRGSRYPCTARTATSRLPDGDS